MQITIQAQVLLVLLFAAVAAAQTGSTDVSARIRVACCRGSDAGDASCAVEAVGDCDGDDVLERLEVDASVDGCPGFFCQPETLLGTCCRADSCEDTLQRDCNDGRWTRGLSCEKDRCRTGSCCAGSADATGADERSCRDLTLVGECPGQWTPGGVCGDDGSCPDPDGTCCFSNTTCAVVPASACPAGSPHTVGGACADACPTPRGACCASECPAVLGGAAAACVTLGAGSVCYSATRARCAAASGSYGGDGSRCFDESVVAECTPDDPTGRCCGTEPIDSIIAFDRPLRKPFCRAGVTQAACEASGGEQWTEGEDAACPCTGADSGSCCVFADDGDFIGCIGDVADDGSCEGDNFRFEAGKECNENPCVETGPCCGNAPSPAATCLAGVPERDCAAPGQVWGGAGASCDDDFGAKCAAYGACCGADGNECRLVSSADECEGDGAAFNPNQTCSACDGEAGFCCVASLLTTDAGGVSDRCIESRERACDRLGGTFFATEAECSDGCEAPERGACCSRLEGYTRCEEDVFRAFCPADAEWAAGQTCEEAGCESTVPEAPCCRPDGDDGAPGGCAVLPVTECREGGGVPGVPGQSCDDAVCSGTSGACCCLRPDGTRECDEGTEEALCDRDVCRFAPGQTCDLACPEPLGSCCRAAEAAAGVCQDGTARSECLDDGGAFSLAACELRKCEASPDDEGACCQAGFAGNFCRQSTRGECVALGRFFFNRTCAEVADLELCMEPKGSCCLRRLGVVADAAVAAASGASLAPTDDGEMPSTAVHCADDTTLGECSERGGAFRLGRECAELEFCPPYPDFRACCFRSSSGARSCARTSRERCDAVAGRFADSPDDTCEAGSGFCDPRVAPCCDEAGDECEPATLDECEARGGTWGRPGASCDGDGCETPVVKGRCCRPVASTNPALGGVCEETLEDECRPEHFTPNAECGDAAGSDDASCTPRGSCCLTFRSNTTEGLLARECALATATECDEKIEAGKLGGLLVDGRWRGGVACSEACEPFGSCCRRDGPCEPNVPRSSCRRLGDLWRGGVVCSAAGCAANAACCCSTGVTTAAGLPAAIGRCKSPVSCDDCPATCRCVYNRRCPDDEGGVGADAAADEAGAASWCPAPPGRVGACCGVSAGDDAACRNSVPEELCAEVGGTFYDGLLCPNVTGEPGCPTGERGACCTDRRCSETSRARCEAIAGADAFFSGLRCAEVPEERCPSAGACCAPGGELLLAGGDDSNFCAAPVKRERCEAIDGATYRPWSTCDELECQVRGACCLPSGACAETTRRRCEARGGRWSRARSCEGDDSAEPPVVPVVCPRPVERLACCLADNTGPVAVAGADADADAGAATTGWCEPLLTREACRLRGGRSIEGSRVCDAAALRRCPAEPDYEACCVVVDEAAAGTGDDSFRQCLPAVRPAVCRARGGTPLGRIGCDEAEALEKCPGRRVAPCCLTGREAAASFLAAAEATRSLLPRCAVTTAPRCRGLGGLWLAGEHETCAAAAQAGDCEQFPPSACCVPGAGCVDSVTQSQCRERHGAFAPFRSCPLASCPDPEPEAACCLANSTVLGAAARRCLHTTRRLCARLDGAWSPGERCAALTAEECPVPPATGRCCTGSDCRDGTTEAQCDAAGGSWGEGLECDDPADVAGAPACSRPTGACCSASLGRCFDGVTESVCSAVDAADAAWYEGRTCEALKEAGVCAPARRGSCCVPPAPPRACTGAASLSVDADVGDVPNAGLSLPEGGFTFSVRNSTWGPFVGTTSNEGESTPACYPPEDADRFVLGTGYRSGPGNRTRAAGRARLTLRVTPDQPVARLQVAAQVRSRAPFPGGQLVMTVWSGARVLRVRRAYGTFPPRGERCALQGRGRRRARHVVLDSGDFVEAAANPSVITHVTLSASPGLFVVTGVRACWGGSGGASECGADEFATCRDGTTRAECAALGGAFGEGGRCGPLSHEECGVATTEGSCCTPDTPSEPCRHTTAERCCALGGRFTDRAKCERLQALGVCPQPTRPGACCVEDAAGERECVGPTSAERCRWLGGSHSPGVACVDASCASPPTEPGCCCFRAHDEVEGRCRNRLDNVDARRCAASGGVPFPGRACSTLAEDECATPRCGSCCFGGDRPCADGAREDRCLVAGGEWAFNTTCESREDCDAGGPETGACCFGEDVSQTGAPCADGEVWTEALCSFFENATFFGGQTCDDLSLEQCSLPEPLPTGACCRDGGVCEDGVAEERCEGFGWAENATCTAADAPCDPIIAAIAQIELASVGECANWTDEFRAGVIFALETDLSAALGTDVVVLELECTAEKHALAVGGRGASALSTGGGGATVSFRVGAPVASGGDGADAVEELVFTAEQAAGAGISLDATGNALGDGTAPTASGFAIESKAVAGSEYSYEGSGGGGGESSSDDGFLSSTAGVAVIGGAGAAVVLLAVALFVRSRQKPRRGERVGSLNDVQMGTASTRF